MGRAVERAGPTIAVSRRCRWSDIPVYSELDPALKCSTRYLIKRYNLKRDGALKGSQAMQEAVQYAVVVL